MMHRTPSALAQAPSAALAVEALRRLGREEDAERLHAVLLASDEERRDRVHHLSVACRREHPADAAGAPPGSPAAAAADAYTRLGLALKALKRLDDARVAFEKALVIRPDAAAHGMLADLLNQQRHHAEAEEHYIRALEGWTGDQRARATLLKGLGLARQGLGREADAAAAFEQVLALCPDMVEVHNDLGNALQGLGRHQEAIGHYKTLLRAKPGYAKAYYNLGNALRSLNQMALAVKCYRQALKIEPRYMKAHNNCGTTLNALGEPEQALRHYDAVLELDPGFVGAYINKGNALQALDRLEEAIAAYQAALDRDPANADAHSNIGHAHHAANRFEAALASYEQARAIRPDHPDAHWNEALTRLAMGDYARGWALYEWRWANPTLGIRPRALAGAPWLGRESLRGRSILIHAEQGLGDVLQFARYLPLVAATGARMTLEVHPPLLDLLAPLMAALPGVEGVIARGQPLPETEFHCAMMSLPLAFADTVDTIPWDGPYIHAQPDRVAVWRAEIDRHFATLPPGAPRVGVVWAGNTSHRNDRNRSAPLAPLAALLAARGRPAVALQKGLRAGDEALLAQTPDLLVLDQRLGDFADTAAVVAQLDLVISVDTSVAHLAGAMGKPLWVMLPHCADWRWRAHRPDCAWYPQARLFRQSRPGDWAGVMADVGAALDAWHAPLLG